MLGISRVEQRSNGGLTVRGVANSGRYASAYGYNGQGQVDLTFKCKTDYRGFVTDVSLDRAQSNYGYGNYRALFELRERLLAVRLPPLLTVRLKRERCAGAPKAPAHFVWAPNGASIKTPLNLVYPSASTAKALSCMG